MVMLEVVNMGAYGIQNLAFVHQMGQLIRIFRLHGIMMLAG